MKVLHVAGTGFGTIAGTLLGQALKKYAGYDITVTDATNLAIYGGGIGLGLAHAVGTYGLTGMWRIFLRGSGAELEPTALPPPVAAAPAPPPAPPPPPPVAY